MSDNTKPSVPSAIFAVLLIALGVAVFAVRLGHPGPYVMPEGGGLIGGLLLLVMGGLLFWPGKPKAVFWIIVLASPFAAFPAIYSIVGETEEVISLYAVDSNGSPVNLRLWIVDRDDGSWVGMPRAKAIEHKLHGARLDMLRNGEISCVSPVLNEDPATTRTIHRMKVEKYMAAQVAGAIGLYPLEATDSTAVLRLDPCNGNQVN